MQRIYVDGELFHEQQRMGGIAWDSHMLVLGLDIIIIHLDGIQIPTWMMCVSTTVHSALRFRYRQELSNKIVGSYGAAFTYQVQANRGPDTYAVTAGTFPRV